MAEIDDNELATLRTAAEFIKKMDEDSDARKFVQKFAKKLNPKIRTEEDVALEYAKPLEEKLSALEKWKGELEGNISSYNAEQAWSSVAKDFNYTADGIKALKEFAEKNGIKNPKHAAAAWDRENPPQPTTTSYTGESFRFGDFTQGDSEESKKAEIEKINTNPKLYEDEQIRKFYEDKSQGKWNPGA